MRAEYAALLRLWFAVLLKALEDLDVGSERRRALDWFQSDDAHPGSFLWICDLFDINATQMRKRIRLPQPVLTSESEEKPSAATEFQLLKLARRANLLIGKSEATA